MIFGTELNKIKYCSQYFKIFRYSIKTMLIKLCIMQSKQFADGCRVKQIKQHFFHIKLIYLLTDLRQKPAIAVVSVNNLFN